MVEDYFGKSENRILYEDDNVIVQQTVYPNEHDVFVGRDKEFYCYFSRGILEELAKKVSSNGRKSARGLVDSLSQVNYDFATQINNSNVSFDEFGWALAKARLAEVEMERDYFISEMTKVKEMVEELEGKIDIMLD